MNTVALLRAIGGAEVKRPAKPERLTDPLADRITAKLALADLWRSGVTIEVTRDQTRVSLRVFLPEIAQGGRAHDHERAQSIRRVLSEALIDADFRSVFTDALWCDKGGRGWSVVGRGQAR